jgi:hypothetical protein
MSANAEIIAELRRVLNERDEARAALAACPDCAMYAERSARFAEQADQLMRERDEARDEAKELRGILHVAGERLKACSYGLTEFSYQEMASVLFDLPRNTEEPTNG